MRRLVPVLSLACASVSAFAQAGVPADEAALKDFLSRQVAAAAPQLSRFDIQLLQPAARAELAPCARTEFFLPAGARAWGRVSVGVRCVQGAAWTVMLPAVVRAWSPGLVALVPLAAGAAPGPQDVAEREVELTREPGAIVRDATALQGRVLSRAVGAGQPLRADMLRAPQVVQAGEPVHLRIAGTGFAITAGGQALVAAAEGQPVRVRTEFGRVLTGVAREGRYVDVAP